MVQKRNKGFTLIELIVAIAIVTTVIFIGYKIINKSNAFSQEQNQINNIQLGFNNLRKYMTEDFKQSKEFKPPREEDMNLDYKYQIVKGDNTIEYKVEYKTKGNSKFYSIKRISNGSEISFIEDQPVKNVDIDDNNTPLTISYNEENKMYSVKLEYGKVDTELYTFDIYNGDAILAGNTQLPPQEIKGDNYLSYCLERAEKRLNDAIEKLPSENSKFAKELKDRILEPIMKILPSTKENPITDKTYNNILDVLNEIVYTQIPYFKDEILNKPKDEDIADEFNEAKFYIQAALYTTQYLRVPMEETVSNSKEILDKDIRNIHMQNFLIKGDDLKDSVVDVSAKIHWIYFNTKLIDFDHDIITKIQMEIDNRLQDGIAEADKKEIVKYINEKIDDIMNFQVYDLQGYLNKDIRNDKSINNKEFIEIYNKSEDVVSIISGNVKDESIEFNIVRSLINLKALVYSSNYHNN